MNEQIMPLISNVVEVTVTGRNIYRFLSMVYQQKIKLYDVKIMDLKQVVLKIEDSDIHRIQSISKRYEVEIHSFVGKKKLIHNIKNNLVLLSFFLIGFLFFLVLINTIFDIEIRHSSKELRTIVQRELEEEGISKYKWKKSFKELSRIKEKIVNEYKDKIEWLEIEEQGTKYIIRMEERKIIHKTPSTEKQHIVAKKSAILVKVIADTGVVLKEKNDYVNKGDIVISGEIKQNDQVVDTIRAEGHIYGEVWYNIKVELPLKQSYITYTGKAKKVLVIKALNYGIRLFDLKSFQDKEIKNKIIWQDQLIPFGMYYETQKEVVRTNNVYNAKEALDAATKLALKKVKIRLKEEEYIMNHYRLKFYIEDNKSYLELFVKVCEDITEAAAIPTI